MKTNNRSRAASKANLTRLARSNFMSKYGPDTTDVVVELSKGTSTEAIADTFVITRPRVGAIAANFTRGAYKTALRNCNVASW